MSPLSSLPSEILSQIAQRLFTVVLYATTPKFNFQDHGICSLRLTCRSIYLKIQYDFSKAAFSSLKLNFHPEALQRRLAICRHPAFGKAVKQLAFQRCEDDQIAFPLVEEEGTVIDQVLFVLKQILEDILSHTPNLEEIVIITPFLTRFHRYQAPSWAEFATVNIDKLKAEQFVITVDPLWNLVTSTVAKVGINLAAIELIQIARPLDWCKTSSTCISADTLATSVPALSRVEHMVTYIDSTKALCAEKLQITGTSLGRSLNAMPFLTWLDLRFANWTWYGANGEIAAALSSLGDVNLPRLQRLSVRTASIDENVLKAFLLTHHSTLRYLRLSAITLTQGGRWYSILATMLVAMTSLNEFYFSYLMEDRRHLRLLVNKHDFVGRTAILKGIGDMLERVC